MILFGGGHLAAKEVRTIKLYCVISVVLGFICVVVVVSSSIVVHFAKH